MRAVAVFLGIFLLFLLFLGTAEFRLYGASCEMIVDRMERGSCLARQIEINTAAKPFAERITQYQAASDLLPDNYLLVLKLAEVYFASGDTRDALPLFDRAESLARPQQPLVADQILAEKDGIVRSSGLSQ